jgi:glycerol uptake facilitator-like aquaporin
VLLTARAIGRAIVRGDLHALWIYLLAPVVGATLGAIAENA